MPLTYMCSSFLHPCPGLAGPAEWLSDFPLFPFLISLGIFLLSSLLPVFLPSSFSSHTATGLLLPSSFFPHVHFALEPEAGSTCTDEVGRIKTAFPTLSSEASAKERGGERVILLLLMLFSIMSSPLFLSASPSVLLSVLALTVFSILSHRSHGSWHAAE